MATHSRMPQVVTADTDATRLSSGFLDFGTFNGDRVLEGPMVITSLSVAEQIAITGVFTETHEIAHGVGHPISSPRPAACA